MDVSLQQAIEIHARSLKKRFGAKQGVRRAHMQALRCQANGDHEGFAVWMRVRDQIGSKRAKNSSADPSPTIH